MNFFSADAFPTFMMTVLTGVTLATGGIAWRTSGRVNSLDQSLGGVSKGMEELKTEIKEIRKEFVPDKVFKLEMEGVRKDIEIMRLTIHGGTHEKIN